MVVIVLINNNNNRNLFFFRIIIINNNNNSSLNSTISSFQTTPSNVPINAFEGEIKIENKNPIHSIINAIKTGRKQGNCRVCLENPYR